MILVGYSTLTTLTTILIVSLIILILALAYRRLLNRLTEGEPVKEEYCVLYDLEQHPVRGDMEIYFTCAQPQQVEICLYNTDFSLNKILEAVNADPGGHIVRFDSTQIDDGNYFFGLRTENQKTLKKCQIRNNLTA